MINKTNKIILLTCLIYPALANAEDYPYNEKALEKSVREQVACSADPSCTPATGTYIKKTHDLSSNQLKSNMLFNFSSQSPLAAVDSYMYRLKLEDDIVPAHRQDCSNIQRRINRDDIYSYTCEAKDENGNPIEGFQKTVLTTGNETTVIENGEQIHTRIEAVAYPTDVYPTQTSYDVKIATTTTRQYIDEIQDVLVPVSASGITFFVPGKKLVDTTPDTQTTYEHKVVNFVPKNNLASIHLGCERNNAKAPLVVWNGSTPSYNNLVTLEKDNIDSLVASCEQIKAWTTDVDVMQDYYIAAKGTYRIILNNNNLELRNWELYSDLLLNNLTKSLRTYQTASKHYQIVTESGLEIKAVMSAMSAPMRDEFIAFLNLEGLDLKIADQYFPNHGNEFNPQYIFKYFKEATLMEVPGDIWLDFEDYVFDNEIDIDIEQINYDLDRLNMALNFNQNQKSIIDFFLQNKNEALTGLNEWIDKSNYFLNNYLAMSDENTQAQLDEIRKKIEDKITVSSNQ